MRTTLCFTLLLAAAVFSPDASAGSPLPLQPVPLDTLESFAAPGTNWTTAGEVGGAPRREGTIVPLPGRGILVNTAAAATRGSHLLTTWEHGDLELTLDFLLPAGSNSGVYLMGRYEIQLFDSWGKAEPGYGDCGGIYQRWLSEEGRGYDGTAPRANACRAPGLWQNLHVVFQAPRFDGTGRKTANARFLRVELNGFLIHENVEVTGPTRAARFTGEAATGPLMIQGDHGPVAVRRIAFKRFDAEASVALTDLTCAVYRGQDIAIGAYEHLEPDARPAVAEIDVAGLGEARHFAATFRGVLEVPHSGTYAFTTEAAGPVRLQVGGETALHALSRGGRSAPLRLTAGRHAFRLDYAHGQWGKPALRLDIEGPGLRVRPLNPATVARIDPPKPPMILRAPVGRVRVQRGFIPFEPQKRLYAAGVGSPEGIHFSYDFDSAAVLQVWSGDFLDMTEVWEGRGLIQAAVPAGPMLSLSDRPSVALLESTDHNWPHSADALWTSQGYDLGADGSPVFLGRLDQIDVADRITTLASPRGLHRTLRLTGKHGSWETGILLAESDRIVAQPDGRSFLIGDRSYYIDLGDDTTLQPFVRHRDGRDQLVAFVPRTARDSTLSYIVVW